MDMLIEDKDCQRVINLNDIHKIKDPVLREIRLRYSKLRIVAFDNTKIEDSNFVDYIEELRNREMIEIEEYRKNKFEL